MNKKGFTLAELLAVIAILALLIILVLPNIVSLFNESKMNSFKNELKQIYNEAQQEWVSDSMLRRHEKAYARETNSNCTNTLNLLGRQEVNYYIKLNKQGKVVEFYAEDGTYQYSYEGEGLDIKDITTVSQISKVTDGKYVQIACDNAILDIIVNPDSYLMTATINSSTSAYFLRTTVRKFQIEKVIFTNSLDGHTPNGTDCWDVSVGETGDTLAWRTDTNNNGKYEITIGANGGVTLSSGSYLFYYLTNLISVEGTEYLDTSKATNLMAMFWHCENLPSIDISHFDTSNATGMSYFVADCLKLTTITGIGNLNTSKVMYMNDFFYNCKELLTLDLSKWNTSNVTSMARMFQNCSKLTTLNVSGWNTSKVTTMHYMFGSLKKVSELAISDWDTSSLTDMYRVFWDCDEITSLDLSGWDTSKVTNTSIMFRNNTSLLTLNISGWDTSNVTNMSQMFTHCEKITTIDVSGWDTSKVTNMSGLFSGCYSLTSLNLSHFDTSKATSMGSMFSGCKALTSLDLSNFNTSNVTTMASMFFNCKGLTSLNIKNFNTSKVTEMWKTFAGCNNLTSLDLSGWDVSKLAYISEMFASCTRLETLDLTGWVTTDLVVGSTYDAFSYCPNLTTIYADNTFNITPYYDEYDGQYYYDDVFYNDTSLIGGAGTMYSDEATSTEYVHVDGGPSNPGYFTLKP